MTETAVTLMGHIGIKNHSSVGFPSSKTQSKVIDINDPNQLGLGCNQAGELCFRGAQIMMGYLNNEKETTEIFLKDGWIRTGDFGYYDQEGYFFITDRIKELIKVKGFPLAPAELEELLRDHPKIMDAAVIGVKHDRLGEVPRAFVVLKRNTKATEKEIQDYIEGKVAAYKKLEGGVTFLEDIPKSATGKILRKDLRNKYGKHSL